MDDYEFHYPQELAEDNLDEVRAALDGHGIYAVATGTHLNPRFGRGRSLVAGRRHPRRGPGGGAAGGGLRGVDGRADDPVARGRGLQLPVPDAVPRSRGRGSSTESGRSPRAVRSTDVTLFLEHKNSEPAMKILMPYIGMTLHVIHTLRARGITNVKVNMDWQHLLMNGESLAEYAALLAAEGLLGHQHANSGWGTFDDDNMVGATAFMETVELAVELRRAGYGDNGERLGLRPLPVHRGCRRGRAPERAAVALHRLGRREDRRRPALREAQAEKDAIRAYELVYAALGA